MEEYSNPLHKAVIEDHPEIIKQLKDSDWKNQVDQHGFTSLDLARLLGRRRCEELLRQEATSFSFKVLLKGETSFSTLGLREFEKKFHLTYRPFLTFPSYQILQEVIQNCPYFFRFEWLLGSSSKLEVHYQSQLSKAVFADTYVKWTNPQLGYGLFTDVDLPEKSFIGEYTGIVRRIDKSDPKLNGYCFHYPTRFWSVNYFVIDALHEGNLARFINHSSQPNLQPLWLVNRRVLHLVFITNQFIAKGSELTFNYGADYWLRRQKIAH
jgi:uncharacterized protein